MHFDVGSFNYHREVVLNFDAIAIGSWWYPSYEMTEAPLLSEEARISPMIEEKRGTRDTYWRWLAGEET